MRGTRFIVYYSNISSHTVAYLTFIFLYSLAFVNKCLTNFILKCVYIVNLEGFVSGVRSEKMNNLHSVFFVGVGH